MNRTKMTDGLGSVVPMWGTELAIAKEGDHRMIVWITTGKFEQDPSGVGYLVGTRTIIQINKDDQYADIHAVLKWSAHTDDWVTVVGKPVPSRHKRVLSQYLMDRWNMGKLRGRIRY